MQSKLPDLDPQWLFTSTGEDKGDDVNFAVGVRDGAPEGAFEALVEYLTAERCAGIFGSPCQVSAFPKLRAVDVLAIGHLKGAGFDKQGKSLGRALLERLRAARR